MNSMNMGCQYCSQIMECLNISSFIASFFHRGGKKKKLLQMRKLEAQRVRYCPVCPTSQVGLEPVSLGSEFRRFSAATQL